MTYWRVPEGGEDATVFALAQLLQWSGGSRPASAVGYIYREEGGNLHRWVVQSYGGVQNFVAAHADVFALEPRKPGRMQQSCGYASERHRDLIEIDRLSTSTECEMCFASSLSHFKRAIAEAAKHARKVTRFPVASARSSEQLSCQSLFVNIVIQKLASTVDVFLEPFRPGVVEKLGLGPEVLCSQNPRLIYGRMTGYGQGGTEFSSMAGHDNNYLALSGTLDFFKRGDEKPFAPANFAGDYAGGAMMLAMGVLLALLERSKSGCGQVIDAAMIDGANYTALPLFKWMQSGFVPVGTDGHVVASDFILCQAPHWSDIYLCKEDPAKKGSRQYVSVQAIEPQFYKVLLEGLGLAGEELPAQWDKEAWPEMKSRFAAIFQTKTRDEWARVFAGTDACCVPVLNATEAAAHPHSRRRRSFEPTPGSPGAYEPAPAPKLSRTPGSVPRPRPVPGANTREVLLDNGFSREEVDNLMKEGVVAESRKEPSKL
ncbi:Amacr [Symbiodinium natans]|uniref:Amacr protein n=1 Tax=Symbiodinium natans TaxID=878477 RepID=A0A812IEG0_9DINO|nr:Amacr [Symbiodinium natans]